MEHGIMLSQTMQAPTIQARNDDGRRRLRGHRLALACALALAATAGGVAAQSPELERKALEHVAERENVSIEQLKVQGTASANFELQRRGYYGFKIESMKDGAIYAIALDDAAEEVVPAEMEAVERVLYEEKYARMD